MPKRPGGGLSYLGEELRKDQRGPLVHVEPLPALTLETSVCGLWLTTRP